MAAYWVRSIKRLLRSEEGPTAVEYAVMLALVVAVCLASIQAMSTATRSSFDSSSSAIANAVGS